MRDIRDIRVANPRPNPVYHFRSYAKFGGELFAKRRASAPVISSPGCRAYLTHSVMAEFAVGSGASPELARISHVVFGVAQI